MNTATRSHQTFPKRVFASIHVAGLGAYILLFPRRRVSVLQGLKVIQVPAVARAQARTRDALSEFLDNPIWEAFKNKINNLADYLGGEG